MFRHLLRDLPNVSPRRSFTLDPATVAPPRRLLFPTLRWSSLVATLLFLVVVGVDVLGGPAPAPPSAVPAGLPAAGSAEKSYAATEPRLGDSNATGGSAETMALPQASPPASATIDQGVPEAASPPLTANIPTVVVPAPEAAALASASPVEGNRPQESPGAESAAPAIASDTQNDSAGGAAAQLPESDFRANQPPETERIDQAQEPGGQGSWWSSYALRIVQVALGAIALVLAGAALWAWRRQV